MKTVRLGEIAESLPCDYGDDPADDAPTFEVVKVSNVSGEGQFHGDFEKRRFRDDQIANLLVKEGELLVVKSSGSKANILSGKTAICGADRAGQVVASNFLLRLRVDESTAVPRFLWYILNGGASKAFVKTIVGASTYPNLKWSLYASHPIPLPPLAEQRRIAGVLDRVEALRAKRRAALPQLALLSQSLFLDLFGDPSTNPEGWPAIQLGDVIFSASDGPHVSPSYVESGVPFLSTRHVRLNGIVWDDLKFISEEDAEIHWRKCKPERGDILYTKGGTTGIAKTVDFETPVAIWVHIALLKTDQSKVEPLWLEVMLNSPFCYQQSQRLTRGIANHDLGLTRMVKIKMYLPPITLQREFARRVTAVEKLKTAHRESLAELDALFASLQHRAFRGEL